ncbi:CaiB/BaiF CoA-transferase family protein [Pseudorhodoferax sp. Leaf265]|uniref:CaiB/BaiF CoA transferase family protein n=1 Tax=Pseudorhodoferax sp. Leaf265 TaxID=1736315 RepID=UPI0006F2B9DB|nr:CoA transferase [Pseudorhodoferax sp. Leaf265]KQP05118.1 carnitine dehydratase [Pseudorhodoferax sp. Leaf265]
MSASPRMLEGLRVVDLTTVIFGPYCTQILADLGAEVIKVEPADGDHTRIIGTPAKTPGMSPVHLRLNRGKRSVDWNLKSEDGRAAMRALLKTADIFVHNVRSEAIARAGLSYEEVKAIKPDILYVHCTGFDQRGPYAGLQAYDDIIQAAAGVASLPPKVDGNPAPRFVPMTMADKVSGLHAAYAVMAGVIHRLRTGEGQRIEVPMFESIASFNLLEHLCDATFVPPTGPALYPRQIDPSRQPMATRDGWIAIAPYLDERWLRFFAAAGHPEALDRPELADKELRRKNMHLMYQAAARILPERSTAEWLEILRDANVPAMRVNEVQDLPNDPQLIASGLFRTRTHPTEGDYLEVGPPVRFSAYDCAPRAHAPHAGEHSAELARELGVALPARGEKK